jgi:hypothetical protein
VSRRNGKGRVQKNGKGRGRGGGGEGRGMTAQFPKIARLLYHWSGNVTL